MKKFLSLLLLTGIFTVSGYFYYLQNFSDKSLSYLQTLNKEYITSPEIQNVDFHNINIIAPSVKKDNGEFYIARDLAKYFSAQNKDVRIIYPKDHYRKNIFHRLGKSVNIYIYGFKRYHPNKSGINIMYLLYPQEFTCTDGILNSILSKFHLIVVSSPSFSKRLAEKGFPSVYIPQFTDTEIFYPEKCLRCQEEILFVGSNYDKHTKRPAVISALKNNLNISVYGLRWKGKIPAENLKGSFIKNENLHKYYNSAQIILNDHREDMKADGFISNRIYDATASGGFIISDYLPEIAEIYHDSIPMYKNDSEQKKLVVYYLKHPEERAKKSAESRKITLNNFTLEAVGKKFDTLISGLQHEYQSSKQLQTPNSLQ